MENLASIGRQADQAGGRFHSLEELDVINRLIIQAKGLAYLLGHSGDINEVVPARIRAAAWGLEDQLDRIQALVGQGDGHE